MVKARHLFRMWRTAKLYTEAIRPALADDQILLADLQTTQPLVGLVPFDFRKANLQHFHTELLCKSSTIVELPLVERENPSLLFCHNPVRPREGVFQAIGAQKIAE